MNFEDAIRDVPFSEMDEIELPDVCLIHGRQLEYDFRSGFMVCRECEETVENKGDTGK